METIFTTLTGHLAAAGVGATVVEVADGLLQRETEALLCSPAFAAGVDAVVVAAAEALGAAAGVEWLRARGLPVIAVTGMLTRSPLAVREAHAATGLPTLGLEALRDPRVLELVTAGTAVPSGDLALTA